MASQTLAPTDCRALLARMGWGVLATVEADGAPYAVPVSYAWLGETLYLATRPGRRHRALDHDARVCLTITEVESPSSWRSVVVRGRALPIAGLLARGRAMAAFARQQRPGAPRLATRDVARFRSATMMRVEIEEVTGRARGE